MKTFTLDAPPARRAGKVFTLGLTAFDQYGNPDASYSGNGCIIFSGPIGA